MNIGGKGEAGACYQERMCGKSLGTRYILFLHLGLEYLFSNFLN
jgi:hypothetical protein